MPLSQPPLVSIVIPTYNQPALLLETLGTVFAQTFDDFEIVVINDGSTDDTLDRLQPLQERHGAQMRVITQENGGIGAARNRGMDEATGRYVALLDHDDLWMPRKLEAQIAFMRSHPQCSVCTVPWAQSDAPTVPVFDLELPAENDGVVRRPLALMTDGQPLMISSSLMIDRERAAGLRCETRRETIEDLAFQIDLLARGALGVAGAEILMIYRRHGGNSSRVVRRLYNGHLDLRRFEADGRFSALNPEDRGDLRAYLAGHLRWCMPRFLVTGCRRWAGELYLKDFFAQLEQRRWKFLVSVPPMLLLPTSLIRRAWPGVAAEHS